MGIYADSLLGVLIYRLLCVDRACLEAGCRRVGLCGGGRFGGEWAFLRREWRGRRIRGRRGACPFEGRINGTLSSCLSYPSLLGLECGLLPGTGRRL